jgi:5-methylcytosine-specific restriction endonuclease McrA
LPAEVSVSLRALVSGRAQFRCEYCLLHEDDSYSPHQVDHIVSRKHGGLSSEANLAYCCLRCNLWKGTDIGSVSTRTGRFHSSIREKTSGPIIFGLMEPSSNR